MRFKTFEAIVVVVGLGLVGLGAAAIMHRPDIPPVPVPRPTAVVAVERTAVPTPVVAVETSAQPTASSASSAEWRSMDDAIMALLPGPVSVAEVKDATPGQPFQVRLYREDGGTRVGHLKVSLHRDKVWDEKWQIKWEGNDPHITRSVSPARDGNYTQHWHAKDHTWQAR